MKDMRNTYVCIVVTYWRHLSVYLFVLLLLLPALKASTHHHVQKSEGVVVGCQQQQPGNVFYFGMRMSQLYDLFKEFLEDARGASPSWTRPDSDVFSTISAYNCGAGAGIIIVRWWALLVMSSGAGLAIERSVVFRSRSSSSSSKITSSFFISSSF